LFKNGIKLTRTKRDSDNISDNKIEAEAKYRIRSESEFCV